MRAIAKPALDGLHNPHYLSAFTNTQIGQWGDVRLVFVAQRQVKPQVLHPFQSQSRERSNECGPDTGQRADRRQARPVDNNSSRVRGTRSHHFQPNRDSRLGIGATSTNRVGAR